jgi:hypothetical protein
MPRDPDLFAILQGYGIPPGPFAALLHQAVVQKWTVAELLGRLYASPEFAQMFPGIFGPQGELIMTPGQYLQAYREYSAMARRYGYQISVQDFGMRIVQGQVSPQEFLDRLEAAARVSENKIWMQNLQRFAKQAGLERFGKKEAFDALLGLAPKKFYDLWEKTSIASLAEMSGVELTPREVRKVQKLSGEMITETPQTKLAFEDLARQIRTTMPLSQLYRFGITKGDLLQLEFGGPKQAEVAERVQRVLATHEAFQRERRARSALYPSGEGVTAPGGQRERPQVQ